LYNKDRCLFKFNRLENQEKNKPFKKLVMAASEANWFFYFAVIFILSGLIWQGITHKPGNKQSNPSVVPQVLGASTQLRGDPNETASIRPLEKFELELKPEDLSAKSALVYDVTADNLVFAKNSRQKTFVASLTKLMTALVAYQNLDLSLTATTTEEFVNPVKPSLGLKPGESVRALDLFYAMLIGSANDAALGLSKIVEAQTQKPFVELMNETAATLGMGYSNFSNPLGFDSWANFSTAEDLLKLVLESRQYSAFRLYGKSPDYEFDSVQGRHFSVKATNRLPKKYPDISAVKTGQTPASDGSIISMVEIGEREFAVIILNSLSREKDLLTVRSALRQTLETFK
jgi:D-alanyl-D-alanine carboxypeptidase